MPRVSFHTLGCKLNYAETSSVERQFLDRGFDVVAFDTPSDVCVINTCTVTERADRECRQIIRRARRLSPDAAIVVTGCYAQLEPERIASMEGVNLVLGAREKFHVLDHLAALEDHACARILVSPIGAVQEFGPASSSGDGARTRAFLKVQDGCDYSCSFCTIPRARGSSRSQSVAASLEQARALAGQGYREIVLTGVNVGDFRSPDGTLADLLRGLQQVSGLQRIRVSSIEPNLLTDEIVEMAAVSPSVCRHFHIPLQSGSDAVLHRMRRRYNSGLYHRLIDRIHRRMPDCGIGADVIVGFPGETDAEFEETLGFIRDLPVSYLHVFTYSERPHTAAAGFASPVPVHVRRERNARLRLLSDAKRRAHAESLLGRPVPVLLEGTVEDGLRFGLTEHYVRVGIPVTGTAENTVVDVLLRRAEDGYCVGELSPREAAA
jgi:threonylcarbamoyladenosine tRNA methylthiotransferase MtaB